MELPKEPHMPHLITKDGSLRKEGNPSKVKEVQRWFLSFILTCIMALCVVLTTPSQAEALHIQSGVSGVEAYDSTVVFAGHSWVVIGYDGVGVVGAEDTVTLLHDKNCSLAYTASAFDTEYNPYQGSKLYAEMTGIAEDIKNTNVLEYGLIASRPLDGVNAPGNANGGGTDTLDIPQDVWPLSLVESKMVVAAKPSLLVYSTPWWLRSPGGTRSDAAAVLDNGQVADAGTDVKGVYGVRPALQLKLSSTLFTSAAIGGKPTVVGQWAIAEPLEQTVVLKFTMIDESLSFDDISVVSVLGNAIQFDYTTMVVDDDKKRLSAVVLDSDGVLKQYCVLEENINGIATVVVPSGLDATDLLYFFMEETDTGDYHTDFASELMQLTRVAPTGLATIAPTRYQGNDGKITGTTSEMEYSSNGVSWIGATDTETRGLGAGDYQVRYKAQVINGITAIQASSVASVTVKAGVSAPDVGRISAPPTTKVGEYLSLTEPTVRENGAVVSARNWQISADGVTNWVDFDAGIPVIAAQNGCYLRYYASNSAGTGYSPNTVQITLDIPSPPTIIGPKSLRLPVGYTVTSTEAFTLTGSPVPKMVLENDAGGKIIWKSDAANLTIEPGLPAGNYTVILKATNNAGSAIHEFTLIVVGGSSPVGDTVSDGIPRTGDSFSVFQAVAPVISFLILVLARWRMCGYRKIR